MASVESSLVEYLEAVAQTVEVFEREILDGSAKAYHMGYNDGAKALVTASTGGLDTEQAILEAKAEAKRAELEVKARREEF